MDRKKLHIKANVPKRCGRKSNMSPQLGLLDLPKEIVMKVLMFHVEDDGVDHDNTLSRSIFNGFGMCIVMN